MVSLKDIAEKCGVSISTVSKALNNQSDIGANTKKRIMHVANEMGYIPNAAAKALKTDRTYNIGVLFSDEEESGLTHGYFSHVLDSFKRGVEKKGYDITFISNDKSFPGRSTYLEHARFRGFDGVCIACVDFSNPEVLDLVRSEIPVVTIDHIFNNSTAVVSDNVGGMEAVVDFVFKSGHRKVAYIHGQTENTSAVTRARLTSFYRVAEKYGVEIPDEYIREAPYRDTRASYEETMKLLKLKKPPTCILYPDDFAALGGIRAIQEMELEIPKDISIAGYDGLRMTRHLSPKLTSLRQDTEKIGAIAAERIVKLVENPKTTLVKQFMVPGQLFEGETVGRPRIK